MDLTVEVQLRPTLRRELLLWRGLIAELYIRTEPSASDHDTLAITDRIFDGLYEYTRRQLITGRPPA